MFCSLIPLLHLELEFSSYNIKQKIENKFFEFGIQVANNTNKSHRYLFRFKYKMGIYVPENAFDEFIGQLVDTYQNQAVATLAKFPKVCKFI